MKQATLFLPAVGATSRAGPWAKGASLVVALHLGAAGLVMARGLTSPPDDAVQGAEMVVEFAPIATSAESAFAPEAQDNDAEEKLATPSLDETLSQKRELDLPTEQVSPATPVEEELRMAQERTRKESDAPTLLQTTEAMIEQKQKLSSQASLAAESAPEQAGKPEDAASAAPDEGSAIEAKRKIEAWQRKIFAHIVRHKRYPGEARAKALAGEALIAFTLDKQGHVVNLRIVRSSGHAMLDHAAMQVLERADPLPVPPVQLAGQSLDFSVPMRFAAR